MRLDKLYGNGVAFLVSFEELEIIRDALRNVVYKPTRLKVEDPRIGEWEFNVPCAEGILKIIRVLEQGIYRTKHRRKNCEYITYTPSPTEMFNNAK